MNEHITPKTKALVILSGGQDSTTCLLWAKERFDEVHAVTFNYGQRHDIEIESAICVAKLVGVASHEIIHFSHASFGNPILKGTSPLVSGTPLEQYEDKDSLPDGIEKTFVPCRNQMFITVAANRAFCLGITNLVTGVCQADSGGYPDCRQDFITAMEKVLNLGTFTGEDWLAGNLRIHTPLMDLTKAESIDLAIEVSAYPYLAYTHTAYDGAFPPLGKDHATLLREKGFADHNSPDPLILRAWKLGLMDLPEDAPNYSAEQVGIAIASLETMFGDKWYAF